MSTQQRNELGRLKRPDEIDEVFGRANPNPERIGCPSHEVLVALSRRERPIGDRAYDHLVECSPCYLEVRALKEAADLKRRWLLTWAAAAVLVLATGSVGWFLLNRASGVSAPSATEIRTELDLRPYALMRGETPPSNQPPLVLPPARVVLILLLPVGWEPGPYEVQIRDPSAVPKVSAQGNADLRNQVTTLEVALEAGSLSGAHQLAVRRDGQEWQVFPVQVK
jgi:hypothetical protein